MPAGSEDQGLLARMQEAAEEGGGGEIRGKLSRSVAVKSVRNREGEAVVQGGAHRGPRPGETWRWGLGVSGSAVGPWRGRDDECRIRELAQRDGSGQPAG